MTTGLGQDRNAGKRCLRIALVNNMPEAALHRTERQFANLLQAAATPISWAFYALSAAHEQQAHTGQEYRPASQLRFADVDAVIVTGTEPRSADLRDEPYWGAMTALFDWLALENVPAMFSCLASHAAVLHFDGIPRRRLPAKQFGLFPLTRVRRHEFTERLNHPAHVAHSRCHEISRDVLEEGGYHILTEAAEAGVDLFVKEDRRNWLFSQGHPEYDAHALHREYKRDVRRFLGRAADVYPAVAKNYYSDEECMLLEQFRSGAARTEAAIEGFPVARNASSFERGWMPDTVAVFSAWLRRISDEKITRAFPALNVYQFPGPRNVRQASIAGARR
jgi:homoserine O-succinyltransferase